MLCFSSIIDSVAGLKMSRQLFWLSDEQWARIKPHLPSDVRGKPRVTGLMPYPQPGELDHSCSQPRVSGFGDTLFVRDGSAPPGRRRQSGISGNLPSVGKASEQPFRPQDTSEFRANPLQIL